MIIIKIALCGYKGKTGSKVYEVLKENNFEIYTIDKEDSFEPILGSRQQAEAMIQYLNENPENVASMNMFGRPLITMLNDGIAAKLQGLPEASKQKLQKALKVATSKQKNNIIVFVF